ncbi:undecaprenyl-phosphate galactose phosphotransferase WbaP [Vibrio tritonius]|uniref:undecaprenyl-phosphate galactose phosphotransferase WbaP n=1 Tax=Vibrio tritonius TaxID=1435069 RepID=UPI0008381623|nr:undecaprenyl-phosphate galactose phosphotransferase WbaP [Vibrio tritonius]
MEHVNVESGGYGVKYSRLIPVFNSMILILFDLFAFIVSENIAYVISDKGSWSGFYLLGDGYSLGSNYWQGTVFFIIAFMSIFWFGVNRLHYTRRKPFWDELKDVIKNLFILSILSLAMNLLLVSNYSVEIWAISWAVLFVLLPLCRNSAKLILNKLGLWSVPCVIIGEQQNAIEAYKAISSDMSTGYTIKAFVNPYESSQLDVHQENSTDVPYISETAFIGNLDKYYRVFIALEKEDNKTRDYWVRKLAYLNVSNISVIPAMRGIPLYGADVSNFFSSELMMLSVKNNLSKTSARILKRCFDIVTSALLLTLLSPFFLFVALMVKRDGGSATFGHERIGFNGKPFKCLKFRTMVMNSQEVLQELLENDPQARAEWDREFKLKNDPRITKIGHFLRKTSLDELPQLWNVLKGEMSLVGPRPVIDEELKRYGDDVLYYNLVKPGMSGLWQVTGRSDTDYTTRVYLDSWYVKNWSLWYDIVILFKTVGVVVRGDGAY